MPSVSRIEPVRKLARPVCPRNPAHEMPPIDVKRYHPSQIGAALEKAGDECRLCAREREAAERAAQSPEERRAQARRDRELWG